jgi:CelD/BcsL family acetyltransferase involved in cellulose biosynthesis
MLRIEEVKTVEGFARFSNAWNNLLENSANKNIFLTFDWLYAWWEYFGKGKELMMLVIKDKAEVVGIAPFFVDKQRRYRIFHRRIVRFIGEGISDYAGIIAAKGREDEVFKAIFDYLERVGKRWDEIILKEVREDDSLLRSLAALLEYRNWRKKIEKAATCPIIEIKDEWEAYRGRISKKLLNHLRWIERKLERENRCEFIINNERADPSVIDEILAINRKRLKEKGKRGWYEKEGFYNFVKHTINTFGKNVKTSLSLFKIDGRIVAFSIAYIYDGKLGRWIASMRDEYKKYSPGQMLLYRMIKETHDNRFINEIDLLRGEEDYKYKWANNKRMNSTISITRK